MDAPTYPPAIVYERPVAAPFDFGVDTVSLTELLSAPATREIVYREFPRIKFLSQVAQFQTHLSAFTLRTVSVQLGMITPEDLAKIDQQLRALPVSERPAL